ASGSAAGVSSVVASSSASRISMGRVASESRFHVTCSPSSHLIFTARPLAQVMRPVTPSSVQRTRLPIFTAGRLLVVVVVAGFFFLLVMVVLPGWGRSLCGRRDVALPFRVTTVTSAVPSTSRQFLPRMSVFPQVFLGTQRHAGGADLTRREAIDHDGRTI